MEQSATGEIQAAANDLLNLINPRSQDKWLANDITKMIESSEPSLSPKCCIYKVPTDLRKVNEKAYTPQHISIGPFHHGDKRLETMEKLKVTYFKRFVQKIAPLNMENLVSIIRRREVDVRHSYSHTSELSSGDYVKMIILDASFIIMFFLTIKHKEWTGPGEDNLTPRLIATVRKDIRLLENQLPFFIIDELYNFAFASRSNLLSFTELAIIFFQRSNTRDISLDPNLKIRHFIDLVRTSFLPQSISQSLSKRNDRKKVKHLYNANQLEEAGVKLKVGSSKFIFDLKFKNGVLEIPSLKFDDKTESLFRNLMAFEQCHYPFDGYFTDYIRVLDFLIDTPKDVDLLVRERILVNFLGDGNAVKTLVNNICRQIFISETNSDYVDLCEDLNKFYEKRRHRWKAILRRDYFSSPWRTASTIAAIILLVLTFTQTELECRRLSIVEIDRLKTQLKNKFEMKDLGESKKILGVKITRERAKNIGFLTQKQYLKKVLKRPNKQLPRWRHTSSLVSLCLQLQMRNVTSDYMAHVPYANLVGSLTYAMVYMRPDILQAVSMVTTEAEYMAVADAIKEEIWLHGLIGDLGILHKHMKVLCDSQSTIHFTKNQVHHS
ncbi:UPF0481 protein At3g47200-like [Alnus glutinosa]|uniref:UPF0481 protein At3g47200-like n=1 Tax=Alnus glutinosa TaxID=3517 RepID=UPI002D78E419|nr:UPF0481 protein At3g47200-like [Alnus glutinosa]